MYHLLYTELAVNRGHSCLHGLNEVRERAVSLLDDDDNDEASYFPAVGRVGWP